MTEQSNQEKRDPAGFEGWAVIELMGHQTIAGYVQEASMFGGTMCRVDVPGVGDKKAWTKYLGLHAIYALTPTDPFTAREAVKELGIRPFYLRPNPPQGKF